MTQSSRRTITVVLALGTVLTLVPNQAFAEEPVAAEGQAAAVNAAVADAVGVAPDLAQASATDDGWTVEAGPGSLELPTDADGSIEGSAASTVTGAPMVIGLPEAVADAEGELAADGSVVYAGEDLVSAVVQPLSSQSLRIAVTIPNAQAPRTYDYHIATPADALPAYGEDGSIAFVTEDGTVVAQVEPPWAVDASGVDVNTRYSVVRDETGYTILQSVDLTGAENFPVVADPRFDWHWNSVTIYMNRRETAQTAVGGTVTSYIPTPWTVWGGRTLVAWAGMAYASGGCIAITRRWVGWIFTPRTYRGGYCR